MRKNKALLDSLRKQGLNQSKIIDRSNELNNIIIEEGKLSIYTSKIRRRSFKLRKLKKLFKKMDI